MTCSNCGAEVADGMKFCFDCGTPVPQVKKCVSCGAELSLKMKFCPECGTNQDGSAPKSSGFSMGDKNVIAGDVIGSKEETHISGNATIIKNEDQTKQVKKCHVCGSFIPVVDGYDCPECGEFTCEVCFDLKYRVCNSCVSLALKKNEEKYKDALEKALEDGTISITERKELKELQTKYGITDQKAKQLEEIVKFGQPQTETNFTTMEKINFEKATELFYEDGKVEEAYHLLEPIYKAHPYEEKVLNIYLPVLVKKDIEAAKKIIKELNVDMLSIYLASIDIAFVENNLSEAERIINKGKQIWKDNSILQSYEAILYIKFAQTTKDKSFLKTAEEIANNYDAKEDKLELSYQIKILKNIAEYKGEDTSFYTNAFCKENNLYTSVVLGIYVEKIIVGKNQEIKTLEEALKNIKENVTIILEPGVYKEHVNFDKKIKIVGLTDSIMNKSSSELPIIVLDEIKTCKITADVEIEGVVFTHEKNLSFNNLQNYADTKYEFNKDKKVVEINTEGYTAIEISSNATLKNIALLDAKNGGFTFTKSNAILENSLVAHSYFHNVLCMNTSSPIITNFKSINSNAFGLFAKDTSNPSLKNCEVYNVADKNIVVEGQASGTFEGCHIYDFSQGLHIAGSATPSFVDCKIQGNEGYHGLGILVEHTSNPSLKNCEILNIGAIHVADQTSATFEGCHFYDIDEVSIFYGATPSFVDCKIQGSKRLFFLAIYRTANPSLKNCEIYNIDTITVGGEATFEGCHIHDFENFKNNGLCICDSATPSFVDCKIHDNKKDALVSVKGTANPSFKDCEVYNGAGSGIAVEGQAKGTYKNCYIHNNKGGNFNNKTSNTIDTSTCRIG